MAKTVYIESGNINQDQPATYEQLQHLLLMEKLVQSRQFQIEHKRNEIAIRSEIINLKESSNDNELKRFMKENCQKS